ncbi:MAG: hypothetical protein HOV80_17710 [Polyangiaceae bacterium]|nr:hypothetical protein [Polyangiaceae bacterium]
MKALGCLLRGEGFVVTLDPGRNFTLPCTFCATTDSPRELVALGTYFGGEEIERPVCAECKPIASAKGAKTA